MKKDSSGSELDIVRHLLESAEAQIRSAKQLLFGDNTGNEKLKRINITQKAAGLNVLAEGNVIEGIFDGEMMLGSDNKKYPVPANYASKSKFVVGDVLKLTIQDDGSFVYKQIKPIERKRLVGSLVYDNNQYGVLAGDKTYRVLMASVTYFKLKPGDTATIAIPATEDVDWAAIESAAIDG